MQTIEIEGQRVLTSGQLAEICGVAVNRIHVAVSKNRDSLTEEDYFVAQGSILEQVKQQLKVTTKAGKMGLWRQQGAITMATLLGNQKAQTVIRLYYHKLFPFTDKVSSVQNTDEQKAIDTIIDSNKDLRSIASSLAASVDKITKQNSILLEQNSKYQELTLSLLNSIQVQGGEINVTRSYN